ncbi:universal stress protein [Pseudomonas aeruginosa]|nr:universal stress protein [Pseudomonas aeruginosa]
MVAHRRRPATRRIAELARQAAAPGARVHLLCAVDAGYALPGRPTLLDYPPAAHECEEARQVLDEACALLAGCELEDGPSCVPAIPVMILDEGRRLEACEPTHRPGTGTAGAPARSRCGDRVIREAPCPVLVEVREGDAQGS